MFGGKGMGGGSGGNVLRSVSRVVTRAGVSNGGFQDPFSSSSSNCPSSPTSSSRAAQKPSFSPNLCLSSFSSPPFSNPLPSASAVTTWHAFNLIDEFDWVSVDEFEDENSNSGFDNFVFGPVPSIDEVQTAVSALHQVFGSVSSPQLLNDDVPSDGENVGSHQAMNHRALSVGSELDWIEPPSFYSYNSRMCQMQGADQVYDAFHLLQTEPSIQRMVISLSSDKAVWDAVLNNEAVQELRQSLSPEDNIFDSREGNGDESKFSNTAMNVVKWILNSTKVKLREVFEKIMEVVKELILAASKEETERRTVSDQFEEKIPSLHSCFAGCGCESSPPSLTTIRRYDLFDHYSGPAILA